jgi:hypothetical protein
VKFVLLQTIVSYMLAGLVFPDLFGEEIVDLRESFYAHRVRFFALTSATKWHWRKAAALLIDIFLCNGHFAADAEGAAGDF